MSDVGTSADGAEDRFYFEYVPARPLNALLGTARARADFRLSERSTLFRHWAREILKARVRRTRMHSSM